MRRGVSLAVPENATRRDARVFHGRSAAGGRAGPGDPPSLRRQVVGGHPALSRRGPLIGVLAFDTLREERTWPEPLVKRLHTGRAGIRQCTRTEDVRSKPCAKAKPASAWRRTPPKRDFGNWIATPDIFWATERARSIFGYGPEEAISMDRFEASVHPDDLELVRQAIASALECGRAGER